jgi:hypothetical protein
MYSRLNLVINELNSIGISKLGDADIVRKIISLLPQQRYRGIITILHNLEDLIQMTSTIVIEKMQHLRCRGKWVNKRSQLLQSHMLLHVMNSKI